MMMSMSLLGAERASGILIDGVKWSYEEFPEEFDVALDMDSAGAGDLWICGDPPTIPEPSLIALLLLGTILLKRR